MKPPQRVWVLMGGDSAQRQASFEGGIAAWLRLRTLPDLQAKGFLSLCCSGVYAMLQVPVSSITAHSTEHSCAKCMPSAMCKLGCASSFVAQTLHAWSLGQTMPVRPD